MRKILLFFVLGIGMVFPAQLHAGSKERLGAAVVRGDTAAIKRLVAADPKLVNIKCVAGMTPLQIAVRQGHVSVARLLIDKGANVSEPGLLGETLLHEAAKAGRADLAKLLLESGADVDFGGPWNRPPLEDASNEQTRSVLQQWLSFWEAVEAGDTEKVQKMLIANKAFAKARDRSYGTPLHVAATHKDATMASVFIALGISANARAQRDRSTPLHQASMAGSLEAAALLIGKGADVDAKNYDGMTPLHLAARLGRKDVAEHLLTAGANINARDKGNLTPLAQAVRRGQEEIVTFLKSKGAE